MTFPTATAPTGAMAERYANLGRSKVDANEEYQSWGAIREVVLLALSSLIREPPVGTFYKEDGLRADGWYYQFKARDVAQQKEAVFEAVFETDVLGFFNDAQKSQTTYEQEFLTAAQQRWIDSITFLISVSRETEDFPEDLLSLLSSLMFESIPPLDTSDTAILKDHYKRFVNKWKVVSTNIFELANEFTFSQRNQAFGYILNTYKGDPALVDTDNYVLRQNSKRLQHQQCEASNARWGKLDGPPSNRLAETPSDGDCFFTSIVMLADETHKIGRTAGGNMKAKMLRLRVVNYMRYTHDSTNERRWFWRHLWRELIMSDPDKKSRYCKDLPNMAKGFDEFDYFSNAATGKRNESLYDDYEKKLEEGYERYLKELSRAYIDGGPVIWADDVVIRATAECLGWRINVMRINDLQIPYVDPSLDDYAPIPPGTVGVGDFKPKTGFWFERYGYSDDRPSGGTVYGPINARKTVAICHTGALPDLQTVGQLRDYIAALQDSAGNKMQQYNQHFQPIMKTNSTDSFVGIGTPIPPLEPYTLSPDVVLQERPVLDPYTPPPPPPQRPPPPRPPRPPVESDAVMDGDGDDDVVMTNQATDEDLAAAKKSFEEATIEYQRQAAERYKREDMFVSPELEAVLQAKLANDYF